MFAWNSVEQAAAAHLTSGLTPSPGHVAGVTQPALLLSAVAAAGPADVKPTVQTLVFDAHQKPEGLQTTDAVKLRQAALVPQQLSLGVFFLYLSF